MNYALHLLIYFCIWSTVALSLNIIIGYCGLLSLAHASFFAVGAYTYALTTLLWGWEFLPALFLAFALGGVLSLLISLPAWRLRGDFFVLIALAVQTVIFSLIYNWHTPGKPIGSWQNLTGGSNGISGIPKPTFFGWQLDSIGSVAVLAVILAIVCVLFIYLLLKSPWGRLLKSMRDDELLARGLGKNTRLVKVQATAIACALSAVGGVMFASYAGYLHPSAGSLDESLLLVMVVMVGGAGNIRGPVIGAVGLITIQEALRFLHLNQAVAANIRLLIFGLLLILMMHKRPQGIAGEYRFE